MLRRHSKRGTERGLQSTWYSSRAFPLPTFCFESPRYNWQDSIVPPWPHSPWASCQSFRGQSPVSQPQFPSPQTQFGKFQEHSAHKPRSEKRGESFGGREKKKETYTQCKAYHRHLSTVSNLDKHRRPVPETTLSAMHGCHKPERKHSQSTGHYTLPPRVQ